MQKNSEQKQKNPKIERLKTMPWPGMLAALYAAAVLVWLPWYATGYGQIAQEKLTAFLGITLLAGVLLAAVVPEKLDITPWKHQGIAAAVYAAVTLAAVLLSGSIPAALWASGGYLGGFMLAAGALLGCMGTAVFLRDADCLTLPLIISGACVAVLGICNNFGFDPLGFQAQLLQNQRHLFFSTIGNADYLSAFLCLWLPLAMQRFAAAERKGACCAAFLCAEVGFLCMASLDSGLAALGIMGAAFLLLLFVPLMAGALARYAVLGAGWAAAQYIMRGMAQNRPLLRTENPFAALAAPLPAVLTAAACLAVAALFALLEKRRPGKTYLTAQRVFFGAAAGGGVVLAVLVNRCGISLGGLDNFLRFGADWATGRGAIWADVWYCFTHGTPLQMLLGRGPGMTHAALDAMGDSLPYALTDTIGAHNEYLELLLTVGAVGLAAYLAFLAAALHTAAKQLCAAPAKRGWLFCVTAYIVQACFNNRVAAVFPLFMVALGVLTAQSQPTIKQRKPWLLPAALVLTLCGAAAGKILLHYLFI